MDEQAARKWTRRPLWSEKALNYLMLGLDPDQPIPSDARMNDAAEDIRLAVLARELNPVSPEDATDGDRMYGHARFFRPADAIRWADRMGYRVPDSIRRGLVPMEDADLDPRERKTLLLIVAALAEIGGLDLDHPHKAAAPVVAQLERAGIRMKADTAAAKLKAAAALLTDHRER